MEAWGALVPSEMRKKEEKLLRKSIENSQRLNFSYLIPIEIKSWRQPRIYLLYCTLLSMAVVIENMRSVEGEGLNVWQVCDL